MTFSRSHWSNLKTAAVMVRVPPKAAKALAVLHVVAVMDVGGRRSLVVDGGGTAKGLPSHVQGITLIHTGRGAAPSLRGLRPISVEVLAPHDSVVLECLEGLLSLRPLRRA